MIEKPSDWKQLPPEEKRRIRLEAWVEGIGIEFQNPEAKAAYQKRATLLKDAVELKKEPERVPVITYAGAYAQRRKGIKQKATMYEDWDKAAQAYIDFHTDFQPDCSTFLFLMSGPSMEMLGQNNMKWAGHGLGDDSQYQFMEKEYMKEDEYELFLEDPSDYYLRYYWPRFHPTLKGLTRLPKFAQGNFGFSQAQMAFLDEEVQEAFELIKKAAALSLTPSLASMKAGMTLQSIGFPGGLSPILGGAPYDSLGDSMRGTRGIMTDLYRQPQNIIAACEKIVKMMPAPDPPLGQSPLVLMPLHKGSVGFMSKKQYEELYWPTFKQVMMNMINEGLIPTPFAEGYFADRLEYILELPKASTVWFFDRTDMHHAKDVLGDHCCLMGNVTISLISTGTYQEVEEYCRNLIDYCGQGGGFILSPSTQIDDGREETVRAMIETAKNYRPNRK